MTWKIYTTIELLNKGKVLILSCIFFIALDVILSVLYIYWYLHKSKIVPTRAMKADRGGRGVAPLILNLSTGWRCVVTVTPRPHRRERTPLRIEQPGWAKSRSVGWWKREKSLIHAVIRNPDRPACSLVTILPTLPCRSRICTI